MRVTTHKAWRFHGPGQPLELTDLPDPVPGPRQVVVDVRAAGLCHSDIGILDGLGSAWVTQMPIVLGHEVSGVVSALGAEVKGVHVGDRVAVGVPAQPVGRGWTWPTRMPGLGRDGGYGYRVRTDEDLVVSIPDGVSFAQAAVATDSVTTAFHAVREAGQVTSGDVVGVIGVGGLGLNAVQIAVAAGATTYGVDISESARNRAISAGATEAYEDIASLKPFEPDVVFDFAGFGSTTAEALDVIRPGGTIVVVGLGQLESTIATGLLVTKSIRIRGSLGGTIQDLVEVLDLIAKGEITPTIEEIGFNDIPRGLERLRSGDLVGRLAAILE
jgi:alcohol dehydrogenase, propanol-preferring